jgi:hypothetical protein
MVIANNNNTKYVPQRIMSREETLDFVTKVSRDEFKNLSDEYKNDRDFVTQVLEICPKQFQHISHELRNDADFALQFIKKHSGQFRYVSYDLKNDYSFVTQVMEIDPFQFTFVSDTLKGNRAIVDIKNRALIKIISSEILKIGCTFCCVFTIAIIFAIIIIGGAITIRFLTK